MDDQRDVTGRVDPYLMPQDSGFSRRRFIAGAGATLASASLLTTLPRARAARSASEDDWGVTICSSAALAIGADRLPPSLGREILNEIGMIGSSCVRFGVDWSLLEPEPHKFDWSSLAAVHRDVVWAGLDATLVVNGLPAWIDESELGGGAYPVGHRALNDLASFIQQLVLELCRYGQRVQGVELWCRPNTAQVAVDSKSMRLMVDTVGAALGELAGRHLVSTPIVVAPGSLDAADDRLDAYVSELSRGSFPSRLGLQVTIPESGSEEDLMNGDFARALDAARAWQGSGVCLDVGITVVDPADPERLLLPRVLEAVKELPGRSWISLWCRDTAAGEGQAPFVPAGAPLFDADGGASDTALYLASQLDSKES